MSGECGGVSSGGEAQKLESQRCSPTPFLTKTYQLVDDPSLDDMISWNEDGTGFVVWRTAEFARDLLPKYFKHNNFSSFIRQLNTYGFRKVVADRWEFAHDFFKRGEKSMLREIQRRKINPGTAVTAAATTAAAVAAANAQAVTIAVAPAVAFQISPANSGDEQVFSSNSSPAATAVTATHLPALRACTTMAEVLEENERLRKENSQLRHDLDSLKNTFGHIFNLVSDYGRMPGETMQRREGKELELLPETHCGKRAAADEMCPKIFGVSIGVKRARSEDRTMIVRGPEAESEPLDRGSSSSQDTLNYGG